MSSTHVPGSVLRDELLEPRGRTAFSVERGQTVRIIDVDGCPQERNPCNAYKPTRLRVIVYGPASA